VTLKLYVKMLGFCLIFVIVLVLLLLYISTG